MQTPSRERLLKTLNPAGLGRPLAVLTACDYPTARLVAESGVDLILVGDSLGMVSLGLPDTVGVTMDDMLRHAEAVRRGAPDAAIVVDLPYESDRTPELAAANACRLTAVGADAVKLEGGVDKAGQIRAISDEDIPVVGHIGMLPQRVREEGGRYLMKGRGETARRQILEDAAAVEGAGAVAIVLELVDSEATGMVTRAAGIPTIGIGSGADCDGQVLVLHDVAGLTPWFRPRFAPVYGEAAREIASAARRFAEAVWNRTYPGE